MGQRIKQIRPLDELSSSMHPRTHSQSRIRIFYLASRRLYQVSNALKRTEINAQGDLLSGVSFLVAGRWSGSSVADVRYRIGVHIFSCGLYGGNNGQASIRKDWLRTFFFFCQFF